MIDYQWPLNLRIPERFDSGGALDHQLTGPLVRGIEEFFEERLRNPTVLFPSGRAGISALLQRHEIDRSQIVFAPKWSSKCLWDAIAPFANPTCSLDHEVDVIIAVHKWGQVEKYSTTRTELIIEDSVDSLCTSPSTLFPNDGTYEIFSLPKIIGSYSGGLIVTKHEELAREIRNLRCDREELSLHQARLRLDSAWKRQGQFQDWSHLEYQNTMLEVNSLRNITACLNNFEINRDTIRMRLDQIMHEKELEVMLSGDPDRLPPVACVPRSSVDLRDEDLEKFMVRHKNVSGRLDRPQFEKVILLPLHFGVSDERFKEFYKTLVTSRSK